MNEKQENDQKVTRRVKCKSENISVPLPSIGNLKTLREIYCAEGSTVVAYTDDLELLAVGLENGSVQLFENGEHKRQLYDSESAQEAEPCTDIKTRASQKNGFHKSLLVTYLGGHIRLWDTKIGKCLFTIKEKRGIYGVTYHPRNSKFATFGNDFKIYMYDEERRVTERILACSEIVGSTNGHTNSVCSTKFHPINPFEIISCGFDGTIQFWDLRVPHAVRSISSVINFGEALDISSDGKTILTGVSNYRNGTIRTYDYNTGEKILEYNIMNTYVYCCQFLTSSFAGIGGFLENSFCILNLDTGEKFGSLHGLPECVMSFALRRKNLCQRTHWTSIPPLALNSGKKVLEMEPLLPEDEEYVNKEN